MHSFTCKLLYTFAKSKFDRKSNILLMRMKHSFLLVTFFALLLTGCTPKTFQEIEDGVVVFPANSSTQAKQVRLQVVSDAVVHVTATPSNSFSQDQSLIAVCPKPTAKTWTVSATSDLVTLSTALLNVEVSVQTGEILFKDKEGRVILQEQKGGGKTFNPIKVEGVDGYELHQVFESPAEEAFYGLGQHQADDFNYKGKNESLFQYNTKVSVPFVVSNKHYGLLWDNYSLSRFGDVRDYAQLNQFKLYDANGVVGGLTATYTPAQGESVVRTEDSIYYEDIKTNKNLPDGFQLSGSHVTYEGALEASETGDFRFQLYYAGYVKVWINNKLIVPERWRTAWNPNSYKFTCPLQAGVRVPIRIDWIPDGGESYLGLRALSPVDSETQNKLSLFSEMGDEINYYFIYGQTMDDVISGYRKVTGKSQIMPKWAMGFWQSRERYKTQAELLDALKEFRRRGLPIDNIVLDWNYWPETAWGSHEFDSTRFPNAKQMIDEVHQMNAHFMISVWPKFYVTTEHYKEFDQKGWMYQQAVKDSIRDWVGPGYVGSFYDAYSADARKLFWKQMSEHLFHLGIDAWWMDASEPNVRDCTDMEYRKQLCGPTALGPSTKYFNAYALMNAEAIYDGQRSEAPDQRVFLLTRSGFAGTQRYSTATWSGDIATRWEDMKAQISAGINFSMSGVPYWTMDIGGFCVEKRYEAAQYVYDASKKENADLKEWRELNARWYQFGAFCPLFRAHGQFPYREIYNIAPENHPAYKTILAYSKLRYNLMPYIYSLAGMTYFNDYTIMRGLIMDFPQDVAVESIGDQYLFGPGLMVCPVYTYGARERSVYFPQSAGWYDFFTGTYYQAGVRQNVPAPYDKMPVFAPAGAIIPLGPDMQYSTEKQPDYINLYVYAGADGSFTLYEDENVNYNYEKGSYSTITFNYNDQTKTLSIEPRKGTFDGMLKNRVFNVVYVSPKKAVPFGQNPKGIKTNYNGDAITIVLN